MAGPVRIEMKGSENRGDGAPKVEDVLRQNVFDLRRWRAEGRRRVVSKSGYAGDSRRRGKRGRAGARGIRQRDRLARRRGRK